MDLDAEERNKRLRVKLSANAQRNARLTYLKRLPDDLRAYLEKCEFITSPEWDAIIARFFSHPIGSSSLEPPGYSYREFSWPEQFFKALHQAFPTPEEAPAYFYPITNPIYHVRWDWAIAHLEPLWEFCSGEMGLVTVDLSTGILISNYSGYLLQDPNPDGWVYELGMWGFPPG